MSGLFGGGGFDGGGGGGYYGGGVGAYYAAPPQPAASAYPSCQSLRQKVTALLATKQHTQKAFATELLGVSVAVLTNFMVCIMMFFFVF